MSTEERSIFFGDHVNGCLYSAYNRYPASRGFFYAPMVTIPSRHKGGPRRVNDLSLSEFKIRAEYDDRYFEIGMDMPLEEMIVLANFTPSPPE